MVAVITDDGLRLLPIVHVFATFIIIRDHNTCCTVKHKDMFLGVVDSSKLTNHTVVSTPLLTSVA